MDIRLYFSSVGLQVSVLSLNCLTMKLIKSICYCHCVNNSGLILAVSTTVEWATESSLYLGKKKDLITPVYYFVLYYLQVKFTGFLVCHSNKVGFVLLRLLQPLCRDFSMLLSMDGNEKFSEGF